MGYSQMALGTMDPQTAAYDQIREVADAGARAAELTRQLLTFSRQQPVKPQNLMLNVVVSNVEKMLRRLIGEDIDLLLSLQDEAGPISADKGQIEQVILNLAVNARDAMPGGGKLSIVTAPMLVNEQFARTHLSLTPGMYEVLSVSDTGTGMRPEVKAHIFEPFFTTKEQGKGTGLGLSTVYGIVQQSGGSIFVYSEPGHGSVFRVFFPVSAAMPEVAETSPAEAVKVASRGNETVLLVEDEEGVRSYIREVLEQQGYRVLEAASGADALVAPKFAPGPISLLLTDVIMPGIGGHELAGWFAGLHPGVPILLMSGYSDQLMLTDGVPVSFLQKPFTPETLLRKVRAVIDRAPGESSAADTT
jgi:CheY-like chemotaxis protein